MEFVKWSVCSSDGKGNLIGNLDYFSMFGLDKTDISIIGESNYNKIKSNYGHAPNDKNSKYEWVISIHNENEILLEEEAVKLFRLLMFNNEV